MPALNKIPTPIEKTYKNYESIFNAIDECQRYNELERVYCSLIKHIAITFLILAKDHNNELYQDACNIIIRSSSLGSWVEVIDKICSELKDSTEEIKKYKIFFCAFDNHEYIGILKECNIFFGGIKRIFKSKGYSVDEIKKLNFRRMLKEIVYIRNKIAHGKLTLIEYGKIIDNYEPILKLWLYCIPFDSFKLYGAHADRRVSFVGYDPKLIRGECHGHFWVESDLLKNGHTTNLPFIQYIQDTKEIYYLNGDVKKNKNSVEHICYSSGDVKYFLVDIDNIELKDFQYCNPELSYKPLEKALNMIENIHGAKWVELNITESSISRLPETGFMVYMFYIETDVFRKELSDVLYVGQSTRPQDRFKHYLAISKGYDRTRDNIMKMFKRYSDRLKFKYCLLEKKQELNIVETAIYNIFSPPSNMISPPN